MLLHRVALCWLEMLSVPFLAHKLELLAAHRSVTLLLCVTAGDIFLKPRLMRTVPCYLDQLCVLLHPSLEKFEEELLEQLNSDRLLKVMVCN